jgi:hypothetical protein
MLDIPRRLIPTLPPPSYVMAVVTLHNTANGRRGIYHDARAYPDADSALEFWTDGEGGCDCNRQIAMWRAYAKEKRLVGMGLPDEKQLPCVRGRKQIIVIELIELLVIHERHELIHAT